MAMLLAAGCAKRGAETSASPGVMSEGDDLAGLEQQLALRTAQLQAVVGPRTTQGAGGASLESADPNSAADEAGAGAGATAAKSGPPQPAPQPAESAPVGGTSRQLDSEDGAMSKPSSRRCEQVCDIAAAICGLEQQICGLVPRHPDDVRYQAACERAAGDCRFATEACHACS